MFNSLELPGEKPGRLYGDGEVLRDIAGDKGLFRPATVVNARGVELADVVMLEDGRDFAKPHLGWSFWRSLWPPNYLSCRRSLSQIS